MTPAALLRDIFGEIHSLSADLKKLSASAQDSAVLIATQSLLETLKDGPQTAPSIAKARGTSRQNIQVIANRLAELGWVEFVPNPNHKKSELVRLTEKGLAQLKASAQAEIRMLNQMAARIPEQELQDALESLRRLHFMLPGFGRLTRDSAAKDSTKGVPEAGPPEEDETNKLVSAGAEFKNPGNTQETPEEEPLPWNLL